MIKKNNKLLMSGNKSPVDVYVCVNLNVLKPKIKHEKISNIVSRNMTRIFLIWCRRFDKAFN
jgi:hypothetical protein